MEKKFNGFFGIWRKGKKKNTHHHHKENLEHYEQIKNVSLQLKPLEFGISFTLKMLYFCFAVLHNQLKYGVQCTPNLFFLSLF